MVFDIQMGCWSCHKSWLVTAHVVQNHMLGPSWRSCVDAHSCHAANKLKLYEHHGRTESTGIHWTQGTGHVSSRFDFGCTSWRVRRYKLQTVHHFGRKHFSILRCTQWDEPNWGQGRRNRHHFYSSLQFFLYIYMYIYMYVYICICIYIYICIKSVNCWVHVHEFLQCLMDTPSRGMSASNGWRVWVVLSWKAGLESLVPLCPTMMFIYYIY